MHITNPIFRDHSKTLKKFKIAQIPKKKVVIGHKQASSIYETYYFLNRNIVNVDNQDFGELKNKFKKIKIWCFEKLKILRLGTVYLKNSVWGQEYTFKVTSNLLSRD